MSEKRFSSPLRWAGVLVSIVVVTMTVGLVAIHKFQQEAMNALNFDYGHSLAEFIARENVDLILLKDWEQIQAIAEQMAGQETIDRLIVTDYNDIVRGSTEAGLVGEPYRPAAAEWLAVRGAVDVYALEHPSGDSVFRFVLPIMFKDIEVGKLYLDLAQAPWHRATNRIVLTVVTQTLLLLIAIGVMGYRLHAAEYLSRTEQVKFPPSTAISGSETPTRTAADRQDIPADEGTDRAGLEVTRQISRPSSMVAGSSAGTVPPAAESVSIEEAATQVIPSTASRPGEAELNIEAATTQIIPPGAGVSCPPEPEAEADDATRLVETGKPGPRKHGAKKSE